jgi:tetratricopeptide (TPR) repeat protein
VKALGDGLMVAFESPSDAVAAAVAMQRSVDLRNRRGGQPLAVRIGIQVGETIEGDEPEPDYLGSPVVQAKRLCDAADGGQILVSEVVGALAGARSPHGFHPVGPLQLKGWPEPIGAVEVLWDPVLREQLPLPSALHRLAADPSPFIGRISQHELLSRRWQEAVGDRRIVLLTGEPGIGKTRLAARLALEVHEDGASVLWGRSAEEALVPYQPFVQALGHYVAASPLEQLRDEIASSAPDLARFVPRLKERLPDTQMRPAEDPESERIRLFEAVSSLLSRISATGPALLVLDDLHWADQGTLLLLRHLARSTDPLSLLILATYRDTEVSRTHPLAMTLAELRRETTFDRVELAGLGEEDVGALLTSLIGRPPPPELTRTLVAETQGNPFFLEEVVRHLDEAGLLRDEGELAAGHVSTEELGVPEGVREVLLRRLQRLGAPAQKALSTASVVGYEFDVDVLARMLGQDPAALVPQLDEGVEARLIVELPDRVGHYGFPHALVQQTLYEEHSANSRALLHAAAGAALEEVYERDLDPYLADLARHYSLAAERWAVNVVRYGRAAGERALELLAYEDAVREFTLALEALDVTEPGDSEGPAELLVLLGTAWTRAGDLGRAREAFATAAETASAIGAGGTLARAALGYGGGVGFGGVWVTFAAVDEPLVAMLERALSAPDVTGPLRVRLLGRLAQALYWAPDRERTRALSAEALESARQLGDRAAIAYALDSRHVALWGPDDLEERLHVGEEMLRLGRELGDRDIQLEAYAWLITYAVETGPIDLVDRYIEAHARVADELRQPYHFWYTQVVRAMRAFMQGRYEETQRLAAEAWSHGESAHPENAFQVNQVLTLFLLREAGQLDLLVEPLEAYVAESPLPAWRSALAMVYADLDRRDDALAQVATFSAERFSTVPRDCVWFATLAMLTQALARCDAPEYCRDIYDLLLPFEDRYAVVGGAVLSLGPISRLLGTLAAGAGDHDRAIAHLEDAIERSRALGSGPLTARAELQMARALRARSANGDDARARTLFESATETAQRIGMPRLLDELAQVS